MPRRSAHDAKLEGIPDRADDRAELQKYSQQGIRTKEVG